MEHLRHRRHRRGGEDAAARPELRFEIEAILAEDARVCVIGGVGAPDAPGQIAGRLIWLFQVSDGRLTDLWTYRAG